MNNAKSKYKFSVVVPLYNGAPHIEKTLDSAISQTYKNYEIVLVNDGSPDNIGDVVKKYIARHHEAKFIYLEQQNKGLGGARNTAIKHATGDIIAILDQDDIWYPEKLEKVAAIYEQNPEVTVVCHNQYIKKNGKIVGLNMTGIKDDDMHRALLFGGNCLSTSATTFRKAAVDLVGYFSEEIEKIHLVEDYDLWMRMALKGLRFYFYPEVLGEYTMHESNYTLKSKLRMYDSFYNVICSHYLKLKDKNLLDWVKFRRLKSRVHFNKFYYRAVIAGDFSGGMIDLIRSLGNDPLIAFEIGTRTMRKIWKIF